MNPAQGLIQMSLFGVGIAQIQNTGLMHLKRPRKKTVLGYSDQKHRKICFGVYSHVQPFHVFAVIFGAVFENPGKNFDTL